MVLSFSGTLHNLTLYSIKKTLLTPLKCHIHVLEIIMENGAFAPFSLIFQKF